MKICVVNIAPIPADYLDQARQVIDAGCGAALNPGTQLSMRVPARGIPSMPECLEDYRNPYYEHLVLSETIETILAADREGFDAIVVNCFDDPGVRQARSLIRTPLFGLSEPTFHLACQLGHKLGALVPDMPGQVGYVQRQIDAMGLASRMIVNGVRAERKRFTASMAEAVTNPEAMVARLREQGRELVRDGAEVVVMACGGLGQIAGMVGFHSFECDGAQVPVVLPLPAAIKTAELLVAMHQGVGLPVPSQAHAGKPLPAEDLVRFRKAYGKDLF